MRDRLDPLAGKVDGSRDPSTFNVEAHERELEAMTVFLTTRDLAERWRVSEETIRSIPFDRLPYVGVGRGTKRIHRRYDPRVVRAFEQSRHGQLADRGR